MIEILKLVGRYPLLFFASVMALIFGFSAAAKRWRAVRIGLWVLFAVFFLALWLVSSPEVKDRAVRKAVDGLGPALILGFGIAIVAAGIGIARGKVAQPKREEPMGQEANQLEEASLNSVRPFFQQPPKRMTDVERFQQASDLESQTYLRLRAEPYSEETFGRFLSSVQTYFDLVGPSEAVRQHDPSLSRSQMVRADTMAFVRMMEESAQKGNYSKGAGWEAAPAWITDGISPSAPPVSPLVKL